MCLDRVVVRGKNYFHWFSVARTVTCLFARVSTFTKKVLKALTMTIRSCFMDSASDLEIQGLVDTMIYVLKLVLEIDGEIFDVYGKYKTLADEFKQLREANEARKRQIALIENCLKGNCLMAKGFALRVPWCDHNHRVYGRGRKLSVIKEETEDDLNNVDDLMGQKGMNILSQCFVILLFLFTF